MAETQTETRASISLGNLKHALKTVGTAIERTSTLPILQCVRIEQIDKGLALEATNLDVYIRAIVSELGGPAHAIVTPAEKLINWTKLLDGEDVKMTAVGDTTKTVGTGARLTLSCGRARATLPVLASNNWPQCDVYNAAADGVTLTQGSFARALRFAEISVSDDASRYTLNGVQVIGDGRKLQLVATNGYSLMAYTIHGCEEKLNLLLPGRFVKALLPLLNDEDGGFDLSSDEQVVRTNIDADMKVYIAAKKISGQFPNWQAAMPKPDRQKVIIKVADLLASLQRCLLLSDEKSSAIELKFSGNELVIEASSALNGEARETVECVVTAAMPELHTRINGEYLLDLLRKLDKEITVALPAKAGGALLFEAEPREGETLGYVIMPMRV